MNLFIIWHSEYWRISDNNQRQLNKAAATLTAMWSYNKAQRTEVKANMLTATRCLCWGFLITSLVQHVTIFLFDSYHKVQMRLKEILLIHTFKWKNIVTYVSYTARKPPNPETIVQIFCSWVCATTYSHTECIKKRVADVETWVKQYNSYREAIRGWVFIFCSQFSSDYIAYY